MFEEHFLSTSCAISKLLELSRMELEDVDSRTSGKRRTRKLDLGADVFTKVFKKFKGLPNNNPEGATLACRSDLRGLHRSKVLAISSIVDSKVLKENTRLFINFLVVSSESFFTVLSIPHPVPRFNPVVRVLVNDPFKGVGIVKT